MADDAKPALGHELARLRKMAELSQKALAEALDCSDATISAMEQGQWKRLPEDRIKAYIDHCLKHVDLDQTGKRYLRGSVEDLVDAVRTLADNKKDGARRRVPTARQLLRDTPAFTGRAEELEAVRDAVSQAKEHGGVIAVHAVDGMPGVGKSAFVTHVATRLSRRFPDGQFYLNLHAHTPGTSPLTPYEALAELLEGAGVPARELPRSLQARAALWRSRMADQRALLILDNAQDEDQLRPLLPNRPDCLVLVTSRRRLLGLDAVTIALDVLPPADAELMFRRVVGRRLAPFEPVAELVELCGRLPMAIALAGARMRNRKTLTVSLLVSEMREAVSRLSALRVRSHQVAAAFELSYRALPARRRRFFRDLALHPGRDLDRYSAAALTGTSPGPARRAFLALFDDNLVIEHVYGRYELHDLMAEFLRDAGRGMPEAERRTKLGSLLDYYVEAASVADAQLGFEQRQARYSPVDFHGVLPPLADRAQATGWFGAERDNLVAVLAAPFCAADTAVALTACMARYLRRVGPWDLGIRLHTRAVAAAREIGNSGAEADALTELAGMLSNHGDYADAETALEQAFEVLRAVGSEGDAVEALLEHGTILMLTGRYSEARDRYGEALRRARAAADRAGEADALTDLGSLHYVCDEYQEAEEFLIKALALQRELGNDVGVAFALKDLGAMWYFTDRYDQAARALEEAIALAHPLGFSLVTAQARSLLGGVLRLTGRFQDALAVLLPATRTARELGDRSLEAANLIETGATYRSLHWYQEAEAAFEASLALFRVLGEQLGTACVLKEYADLLVRVEDFARARTYLDEARAGYESIDERLGLIAVWNSFGALALAEGDLTASRDAHNRALALMADLDNPFERAAASAGLGKAAHAAGDVDDAYAKLTTALEIFHSIGSGEAGPLAEYIRALPTTAGRGPG